MKIKIGPKTYQVKECKSILSKLRGFMFNLSEEAILFPFKKELRVDMTMLFVFHKLQILYLDKNKKIIKSEIRKPFEPLFFSPKCQYILELKDVKSKFKMGSKIITNI